MTRSRSSRSRSLSSKKMRRRGLHLEPLEARRVLSVSPVVISEIASADSDLLETRIRINTSVPFDGATFSPDWIELHNTTNGAIDLGGYQLTDSATSGNGWSFPSGVTIAANGYLVVFASGQNLVNTSLDETGRFHADFKLNDAGEYLALKAVDGTVLHSYAPEFPRLYEGYTVGMDALCNAVYFSNPTPGAANDVGSIVSGFVSDTSFSVDRGFHETPFNVIITSATPGATIAYTLDGSRPSLSNGVQVSAANANTPPSASVFVGSTTALRARAYFSDWVPTNIDTQTYIFVADVADQSSSPSGFPSSWGGAAADYAVDPDIVDSAAYAQDFLDGLKEIPTISINAPVGDIFGGSGIYSNTTSDIEVTASAEMFFGDNTSAFQVDAGLKIQGGASRNPGSSPKHALSLRFRDAIQDGKLDYDLYPGSPVTEFDSLQLRARYNNSWIHRTSSQRQAATYIRDVWLRDSMLAMGHEDAGRGRQSHLYINGLYWGIYEIEERPEASHYAAYHGGSEDEYDALNGGSVTDGSLSSYNAMKSVVSSGNWAQIQQVLDVDNFIDWTILQWFGGNRDLKGNGNWRAAGGGPDNAPWRYYLWDSERILESVTESTVTPTSDPSGLLAHLDNLAEFRIRFADRIQQHFFHDGALTPENNAARWQARMAEIQNAIVGESARWGDYRSSSNPYDRGDWDAENNRILTSYFPQRTANALDVLANDLGLYPSISAPNFEIDGSLQHGGQISVGAELAFDTNSSVYYTLDGTDPRAEGGAAVGTLFQANSSPVVLNESTTVMARIRVGTTWSALTVADFVTVPAADSIVVTEINYHPYAPTESEIDVNALWDADDFEFIEITNTHPTVAVNVLGMQFVNGIEFTLPDHTLAPGERALIVNNRDAFEQRYGTQPLVLGEWTGGLSNGGESLNLVDALGNQMMNLDYGDGGEWPNSPDGVGATLQWTGEFTGQPEPTDLYSSWVGSVEYGGSPGFAPLTPFPVVVNEVIANASGTNGDAIELYNLSDASINLGGWYLSDSKNDLAKYALPADTVVPPGGYLVIPESEFNPNPSAPGPDDFGLSGTYGDDVWLTIATAAGDVQYFVDDVHFDATLVGESLSRVPDGVGPLSPVDVRTLGCENQVAHLTDLVITEINYSADPNLEFLELYNQSSSQVDLSNWKIRGGIEFDFSDGQMLPAGSSLVVLPFAPFDPANQALLVSFGNTYTLGGPVVLVGGFSGKLSNSGEPIRLIRPGTPSPDDPLTIPNVLVEEVVYGATLPWDATAAIPGRSLNRRTGVSVINQSSSWVAAAASPGTVNFNTLVPGDLTGDLMVTASDIDLLTSAVRNGLAIDVLDLDGDASVDFQDVVYLVQTLAGTEMGDANLDGTVDDADFAVWNAHRFDPCSNSWSRGDFNGDGFADVSDFNIWNENRSPAANRTQPTPVPVAMETSQDEVRAQKEVVRTLETNDVNADGFVTPLDALQIINALNASARSITRSAPGLQTLGRMDTTGDGALTPLDALAVINQLNADALPSRSIDAAFADYVTGEDEDEDEDDLGGAV